MFAHILHLCYMLCLLNMRYSNFNPYSAIIFGKFSLSSKSSPLGPIDTNSISNQRYISFYRGRSLAEPRSCNSVVCLFVRLFFCHLSQKEEEKNLQIAVRCLWDLSD